MYRRATCVLLSLAVASCAQVGKPTTQRMDYAPIDPEKTSLSPVHDEMNTRLGRVAQTEAEYERTVRNDQVEQTSFDSTLIALGIGAKLPGADGYLAVGAYDPKTQYRNFQMRKGPASDGRIQQGSVLEARWSVYLRGNLQNTDTGLNPILGVVSEAHCAEVLEPYPDMRGQ